MESIADVIAIVITAMVTLVSLGVLMEHLLLRFEPEPRLGNKRYLLRNALVGTKMLSLIALVVSAVWLVVSYFVLTGEEPSIVTRSPLWVLLLGVVVTLVLIIFSCIIWLSSLQLRAELRDLRRHEKEADAAAQHHQTTSY